MDGTIAMWSDMQRGITTNQPERALPGVIETIAEGLSVVLYRPALIIVPILLDLYLWLGWKISLTAITNPIANSLRDVGSKESTDLITRLNELGERDAAWLLSAQTPSLVSTADRAQLYVWRQRPEFAPESWWLGLLVMAGLIALAALLPMLFAVPIADAVTGRERGPLETARAVAIAWARFFALALLIIVLAALAMVPFIVGGLLLLLGGAGAGSLLGLGALLVVATIVIALSFAPDAIVVSEVGPVRAIRYSLNVVRSAFWQSVALVGASTIISIGLGELWLKAADTAPGLAIGVLLNAYIAAGLALASMHFYWTRIRLLLPEGSTH